MSGNKKNVPKRRFKEFENTVDWEQRKLGDIAEIVRGASPRPIQDPKWFDNENSEIGWLRISDVTEQNGRIHFLEQKISKEGQEKTRVLLEPHLLLSIAATVGKPVINYVKTGVHDGFLIFLNPQFDKEYMFQWLEMFRPQWQQFGQPGSQVNLNSEIVRNAEICMPTIKEQQKMGNFFTNLDNLITLHQRKLEKVKALKKAYLTEMFPADGERIPKLQFAGFTEDWEQHKLNEVAKYRNGKAHENCISPNGRYIVVNSKFVSTDGTVRKFSTLQNEPLYKNEIAFVLSDVPNGRAIARTFLVKEDYKYTLNQRIAGITPNDYTHPYFLHILMNRNKYFLAFDDGAKQTNLSVSDVNEFEEYYPKYEEQRKIGAFFNRLDNLITLHQRKLDKLQNIKKAYLNEMFV